MTYNLGGRTVAITGSTGGLGDAIAAELRDRKAKLALLDLDANAVADQAEELGGSRVARGWEVDVRNLQSLETAMQEAAEHFGRLDVVIAAAGIGGDLGPMLECDPDVWEQTIDINLNGVWRTFKAAYPHIKQQNGHMVAISSMAAFVHTPFHGPYPASKAGVWALCDSLRLETRHHGVTVGSVHPSFFKSPMTADDTDQPAVNRAFNDFNGAFEFIPREIVVEDIISGIEDRTAHVVSPRKIKLAALVPGLFQKYIERFELNQNSIKEADRMFRGEEK